MTVNASGRKRPALLKRTEIFNPLRLVLILTRWLCLFLAVNLSAGLDDIKFDRISLAQGLSQVTVNYIYQDRQGFLWISTLDGLNKFDGYNFKVFKYRPFDPQSLSNNIVQQIVEDSEGGLWVVDNRGILNRFDKDKEIFHRYEPQPDVPGRLREPATIIYTDRNGVLWVGTRTSGLYRYQLETDTFKQYSSDPNVPGGLSHNRVTAFFEDRDGNLWIGTGGGGLNRFNRESETFDHFMNEATTNFSFGPQQIPLIRGLCPIHQDARGFLWVITIGGGLVRLDPRTGETKSFVHQADDPNSISHNLLLALFPDSTGKLWIGATVGGIDLFDPLTERVERFRHDPADPFSIGPTLARSDGMTNPTNFSLAEDKEGNIWIGTSGAGLNVYEPGRGIFRHYERDLRDPTTLADNTVNNLLVDRSGTVWVGTFTGGLSKFSRGAHKFKTYRHQSSQFGGLEDNTIFTIYEDQSGRLWVGTRADGLNLFDRSTGGVLVKFKHNERDPYSLPRDFVRAILEDSFGNLWVGTDGGGLSVLDWPRRRFKNFQDKEPNKGGLIGSSVSTLLEDSELRLWVGTTDGGFSRFMHQTQTFKNYRFGEEPSENRIMHMLEDRDGKIWVGSGGGLFRFDPQTEEHEHFVHDIADPHSISHNTVVYLHLDQNGNLWIGTYGGGVNRFHKETRRFEHFIPDDGPNFNGAAYAILEDEEGYLWISTNRGILRFSPGSGAFRSYDVGDGLQSNEFINASCFQNEKGEMYFGGVNGFNVFHPSDLEDNPLPPPIAVTAFKQLNRVLKTEVPNGHTFTLSYHNSNFSIEFAALDYTRPEKNQFAYMLEGYDHDWIYSGTRRTASYTNLDGGNYTFRVKGSNSDNVWNETGSAVTVIIKPAFWKTWWFYLLVSLFLICLIVLAFLIQVRRLEQQKARALLAHDLRRKTEELETARRLQIAMLPKKNIDNPRVEIFGSMRTATEVGGDYYDFCELGTDRYFVSLGDATGHGMASGLVVGMTKMASTLWRHYGRLDVKEMIENLNIGLKGSLTEKGMGMCYGVGIMEADTGKVCLASSGMPYPYHFERGSGSLHPLVMRGVPLGFLKRIKVQSCDIRLAPDDLLIFLSDGFGERFDPDNEMWGNEALEAALINICKAHHTAASIAEQLFKACDGFAAGRSNEDDMTIVVVRLKG